MTINPDTSTPFAHMNEREAEREMEQKQFARQSQTHELKTLPEYFCAVWENRKPFEVRRNDRDFTEGDFVLLREWSPEGGYTGREIQHGITYILPGGQFGIDAGYCVLGLGEVYE